MHIKTVCPQCDSSYQVDPGLKGKRMRCPNPMCRAIFEVRDAAEMAASPVPAPPPPAAPVPPAPSGRSGSVGDMVPILSAEAAAPPAPPPPSLTIPAREPAPVLAAPTAEQSAALDEFFAGARPVSVMETGPVMSDGPAFGGWQDAPPVRQEITELSPVPEVNGVLFPPAPEAPVEPPPHRRFRWMLAALVVLLAGAVGGVVWLVEQSAPNDEADRLARAEKAYKDRDFGEARALFDGLVKDFPDSEQRGRYDFLRELSGVRDRIHRTQTDIEETAGYADQLLNFLAVRKSDAEILNHYDDIADSLYKLVEELTGFASRQKKRNVLEAAKKLKDVATKYKGASLERAKALEAAFQEADKEIKVVETRNGLLEHLTGLLKSPDLKLTDVEEGPQLAKQAGLADDPEVKALLDKLPAAHRDSITFRPDATANSATGLLEELPPSGAVVIPPGPRYSPDLEAASRPVLALVRGVLYAYDPHTGTLRWARRLGVDTTMLPTWLPATAVSPPTLLVGASDSGGIAALDARDGSVLWVQLLGEPCTGKPLFVSDRVLVACRSGAVHEIEIHGGRRLGGYDLRQPLMHGGIQHPGTNLVYFTADRGCVFALDIAARKCVGVLYTGHASGSVRVAPVLLPILRGPVLDEAKQGLQRAHLLLCQDDGKHGTQLVTFELPLGEVPPAAVARGDKLTGRVTFPPLVTAESVAVVTDTGTVAVFGLKQRDNRDPDLFLLLREQLPSKDAKTLVTGPAQVVHADGQNLWILARGRLHHWQAAQSATEGWKLASRPTTLSPLGTPLHEAQAFADDLGASLAVVTEAPDGRACWLTVLDAEHHTVRWQRQLGLICQGVLATTDGKVLATDRAGTLLLFDSAKSDLLAGDNWLVPGKPASASLIKRSGTLWLLPSADPNVFTLVAVNKKQAFLWKYPAGESGKAQSLEAEVAGTPAVVGEEVWLPLANGKLVRLSAGASTTLDRNWRSPDADANAVGHVLALGAGKVAATNGSSGFVVWRFDGTTLQEIKAAKVKARILSATAVPSKAGNLRICVADADRGVTLFQGDELKPRQWVMSDTITAGPFACGEAIAVVVGGRRLVWLDPDKEQPVWAYTFRGDIVGRPLFLDGVLIVADDSGQIQAFDPAENRAVGLGYTLRAELAPAAGPVAYGADRLFVPLSDGTVLLLSRDWFRPTILGLPVSR